MKTFRYSPSKSIDTDFAPLDLPSPLSSTPNSKNDSWAPSQMVCPVKSCRKVLHKKENSDSNSWKNLFTHMKAHHRNAYVIFRRLERTSTKKQCSECLFWFINYRDYGAHNQHTGNKREESYKGKIIIKFSLFSI